jgi:hypothetical protein
MRSLKKASRFRRDAKFITAVATSALTAVNKPAIAQNARLRKLRTGCNLGVIENELGT